MEEERRFYVSKRMERLQKTIVIVPENTKMLSIDVHLPEECRYMCYLILEDAYRNIRLQKLLGFGKQQLAIGEDGMETTIGGVPGPIPSGEWSLYFGTFPEYVASQLGECEYAVDLSISTGHIDVTEPIGEEVWTGLSKDGVISIDNYCMNRVFQTKHKWYKGDFHTHTTLSDGKYSHDEIMQIAQKQKMDFYVPTEHNLMHTGWCTTDCCIVPGMELTTEYGHCNFFGITKQPKRLLDIVKEEEKILQSKYVSEMIEEANRNHWLVSINHPFLTVWKWRFKNVPLNHIQCLEIMNDPTYPYAAKSNKMAIAFLDMLWNDGHRIVGVGGSDAHNLEEERYEGATLPSIIGDPATYVYANRLSPVDLLEAVQKGHVYVSRFCTLDIHIEAEGEQYLPGDILPSKENIKIHYKANIRGLEEKPKVFLVVNGEYFNLPVDQKEDGYVVACQYCLEGMEWQWVRLEVQNLDGEILAYVNPVSYGQCHSRYTYYGEVLDTMEDCNIDQRDLI